MHPMTGRWPRALLLVLAGLAAGAAGAQTFVQRLNAGGNAVAGGQYGFALATAGDWLAVSELYGLAGGSPAVVGGAVELWRLQSGAMVREQRILAPAPANGHLFGAAVALTGQRLAVIEPGAPGAVGQVHSYRREGNSWQFEATLAPPAPAPGAQVLAVALHGDWLLMGVATGSGSVAVAPGQVLAWRHQGGSWALQQVLVALDSSAGDGFGARLALPAQGQVPVRAAIGAPLRDQGRGAVYVFVLAGDSWLQEQRLLLPQATPDGYFGFALAVNGDLVAGGGFADAALVASGGRVGLWRRTGSGDFPWQADTVLGAGAQAGEQFGRALALPTPRDVVIGSPGRDLQPTLGPLLVDTGAVAAQARRLRGSACATPWSAAGGPGNPAAIPRAESYFGASVAADRLVAAGAPLGEVVGVGRAGFVDVSVHDRLLDSDLDCSP
jgi:hypothetical protein